MGYSLVIKWMIAICAIFMGLIIFSKPLKYILRFLIQAFCGTLMAIVFNFFLSPFGMAIGINYLNFFIMGLLGIPGFVSLYVISAVV